MQKPGFRASVPSRSFSLSLHIVTPVQHRKPPPPPQQEALFSHCAREAKGKKCDINCGSTVYLFVVLFFFFSILISSSQTGGGGANAQIAWDQSAEWPGQGPSFHTQRRAPKKPPSHTGGKQGGSVAYTRLRIPGMVL